MNRPTRVYEFERYCATLDTVYQRLEEYGVAILPGVLNSTETEGMLDGMWTYLEHITQQFSVPVDRNRPETWKSFHQLFPKHGMLLQHWGIGQCEMMWNLRQHPKIIQVFEKLYQTNDLLVSFDGASFHFPPEITGRGWYRQHDWLHTDQSYLRNNKECVQGWVTANPVEQGDATLTILEGSHNFHADFAKTFNNTTKDDWYKLEPNEVEWYLSKGCAQTFIACPAGSLVLWDSRTIHCGVQPVRERTQARIRCVGYVCYTPRAWASPKDIVKRIDAFNNLRMTTHWPHKPKLFPKLPRTYGAPVPEVVSIEAPQLTDVGKRLVGF